MHFILHVSEYLQKEKKWLEQHVGPDSRRERENTDNVVRMCMVQVGVPTCIGDNYADHLRV